MRYRSSIFHTFMYYMLGASFFSILAVGYFWISQEYKLFKLESEQIKHDHIESQKRLVRNEVEKVVDYLYYMRSLREKRLKDSIRDRVYEACDIAENIYNENKSTKSNDEIIRMIKDALRPIRFSDGRGYYFATTIEGIEVLFADRPEYEGTDMLDFRDTRGKYIIRDMIDIVSRDGEGYYEYSWTKPNGPGNDYPKIAYVKLFEPLGFFIGTGEYLDDVEDGIKREILDRIASIRFGTEGYIFVVSYDGVTLMNDTQRELIGLNIWDMSDPNGVKVIQEERRAASVPGGDFIDYVWEKPTTGQKSPKISFVRGIEEWEWMIGAGVYVDEFQHLIEQNRTELTLRIRNNILKISVILLALLAVFYTIARYFTGSIRKSFEVFSRFFENAATMAVPIVSESLRYDEFISLAQSANSMLENRKKAEDALKDSEKRYRRLFEQSYDAVFIHDFDGTIQDVNESATATLGYGKDELLNLTMRQLYPEKAITVFSEGIEHARAHTSHRFESRMLTKNGNEIHVDVSMRVIDASRGIVQEIVRDVTEQKRLEEQLQIRERMDSLGTLAGGIAHDFNNLLAGIMGNLDLLRFGNENRLTSEMQGNIDEAFRACERSAMLIKDIQSLSTGSVAVFTSVDVYSVAREVFAILERTTDRLIEKKIDFDEGRFYVFGKSDQIHQVFLNLGTNAVQAIEEKGVTPGDSITVSAVEYNAGTDDRMGLLPREYIAISFTDTGTGMNDEVRNRAFDPLFSTKQRGTNKGQGLGLAMVYNIVTRGHNGHISIDTAPGFGTTFVMYLPKADFLAEDITEDESADLRGSENILIVEDEEAVREVARKILNNYGYKTITAVNGREGIDLYRMNRESVDLVLLDLTMPVMSGRMVLEELNTVDPDVRVLIASGHSEEEIKNLPAARGYVKKPYKTRELISTIRTILDS